MFIRTHGTMRKQKLVIIYRSSEEKKKKNTCDIENQIL